MQSKTSWFNGTLFKKNFTRFWPVWSLYLVVWTFVLPFMLLAQMTRWPDSHESYGGAFHYFADAYVLNSTGGAALSAAIFGVLAAMAVFSYLYNNRSTGMFHALPVTRDGLFLTNYLSGLLFLAGPTVAVFFLTLGAEAIVGVVNVGALCMWLVVHLLSGLFFYSFAVFCAIFTGNILALLAFYGVLNLLAFVLYQVVEFILDQFLFGYWSITWIQDVAEWLTPCWRMSAAFHVDITWGETGKQLVESMTFGGLTTALVYGFVGVVLAVAALILYRKRHLESAGDVVSVPWVRPIFKYGVGVCAALVFGTLLYGWFGRRVDASDFWWLCCFLLPCGAVGYFAAEMLLKKSFRAFEHWKGCLVMLAAVALCMGAVRMDVFGYGSRIPQLEEVKNVSLSTGSTAPYDDGSLGGNAVEDEAYIQAVLELHAAIVAERDRVQSRYSVDSTQPWPVDGYETYNIMRVSVSYELKNGGAVSRAYYLPLEADRLAEASSYDAKLQAMSGFPEVMLKNYSFFDEPDTTYKLVEAELSVYNTVAKGMETVTLPAKEAALLRDAVKSDLLAGRLGQRFLMNDESRMNTCYANDISFYFLDKNGMDAAAEKGAAVKEASSVTSVTILTTATDTIGLLEELGVLDGTHTLMTQEEMRIVEKHNEQPAAAVPTTVER